MWPVQYIPVNAGRLGDSIMPAPPPPPPALFSGGIKTGEEKEDNAYKNIIDYSWLLTKFNQLSLFIPHPRKKKFMSPVQICF